MGRKLSETPSQTAGPYLHVGLAAPFATGSPVPDHTCEITGTIWDGEGASVCDALIEMVSAPEGWQRTVADGETGAWSFRLAKPQALIALDGRPPAPHIALWIAARGINTGLHTRLYFPENTAENAADPVLSRLDPARRATLIAQRHGAGYRLDIRLQGSGETVFFDL